ncbi:hypothetical protein BHM03_00040517, partial [Ensete ventricosum]
MLQGVVASCRHTVDRNRVTITLFPLILPLFCCDWPNNITTHSQRCASAAHLLSAATAPLLAAPFRRSYSASRRNTSMRLTARRAHLRLFLLNISTRLSPFLCFPSQLLPATSVFLSPAESHTYSQPALLFIAGCFLFFSSPNHRIYV